MPLADVRTFIASRLDKRFALVTHMRPDGDAIGSAIGLAHSLARMGCSAKVVNPLPLPADLAFVAPAELIAQHDEPEWWRNYDCLGVLDCGDSERVSVANRGALGKLPAFTIDHHATSTGLGEAIWIEPHTSSTGEMVTRLLKESNWPMEQVSAMALWTAIVTDTGRFCFENTSPSALEAARDCLLAGADPALAAANLYQSVSVPERRLERIILERMQLLENGRLALSWLRRDDFAKAESGVEGAQNLINILRDTAGVEVAVFFYEPPTDTNPTAPIKVSLRTRSPHNALDIATQFSGGGHQRAAGCSLPGPMDAARATIVAEAKRLYFGDM